ncbi:hypothetical protein V1499_04475 [Neobacillus sp. SCS-31]
MMPMYDFLMITEQKQREWSKTRGMPGNTHYQRKTEIFGALLIRKH